FISYMETHHGLQIGQQVKAEKWLMPHIRPGCSVTYGQGRVLFAGEIAGFLNPMGEGISAALESGAYAAQAVCDNFSSPADARQAYKKNTAGMQEYMRRQWEFLGRISPKFYKP
ncbi:MAG: NAD(P)/FAD-dependent oxidoreductase, partial [Clostridiales bacterium]|nr:NAD(P)/FAD-dependent oxidoreductase [Clostridiales bacterium]